MLLCESCNGEYHLYCLNPKLKKIPDGDWFCGALLLIRDISLLFVQPHFVFAEDCKQPQDIDLDLKISALPKSYTSKFGAVVWANGGSGYGWWPACIFDPRWAVGNSRSEALKHLGSKHLIYFFSCDETPFATLPDSKIMDWNLGFIDDCQVGRVAATTSKSRGRAFREALKLASSEVMKPPAARLDWELKARKESSSPPSSPIKGEPRSQRNSPGSDVTQESPTPRSRGSDVSEEVPRRSSRVPKRRRNGDSLESATSLRDPESVASVTEESTVCQVYRRPKAATNEDVLVGWLPLSRGATFSDLRREMGRFKLDVSPLGVQTREWAFLTKPGPLASQQESTFGPQSHDYRQLAPTDHVGTGTYSDPIRVVVEFKTSDQVIAPLFCTVHWTDQGKAEAIGGIRIPDAEVATYAHARDMINTDLADCFEDIAEWRFKSPHGQFPISLNQESRIDIASSWTKKDPSLGTEASPIDLHLMRAPKIR